MDGFKHNKLVLTALAVVMLFGSSFSQKQLNRDRAQLGLVRTDNPLENAPPMLAFTTVALGGFRGLIANALWIRATDLQQDGKYFEMVQLADWITKLQPHFTTVWIHQAWNMAYNISVKFPDKEDRWRWVRRGIELLRDEAIPLNPHEPLLYRELAWFFQHKMGQNMDDGHLYYKFSWAYDFQKVIGEPPYSFDRFIEPKTDADRENGRQLKDTYKMEAKLMKSIDEQYGPLDWRLPEAHAIYWASKGLEKAKGNDLLSLRRVVYQSMQTAFTRGRLVVNKIDGNAELSPNPDIVQRVNDTYEEMIRANPMENIGHAHQNFLRYAVTTLYLYNREAEARKWWNVFRAKYPEEASRDPVMENYIVQRVTEIVRDEGKDKILAAIEGYLSRSYYLLAIGEDDQALGYERFASQCWVLHQKKIDIERKPDIKARLDLGPYKGIKQRVLDRILDSTSGQFSPQLAAQLRTRLGLAADTQPT
ncbi:MAG TPA: hypothetical protein VK968_17440, partial [Roseimicrobium sp.]|nr:hypothetical protein [Roseimicrobium sp.]